MAQAVQSLQQEHDRLARRVGRTPAGQSLNRGEMEYECDHEPMVKRLEDLNLRKEQTMVKMR